MNPEYAWALAGFIMIAVAAWVFRRDRWVVFAGLFYILSIFFVWQIARTGVIIVAERFMYIPCIGFVLLVAAVWDRVFLQEGDKPGRKKWVGWVAAGMLCAILAGMTFQRCWDWQDSLTFWDQALRENVRNTNAYNNRGTALIEDPFVRRKYGLDLRVSHALACRDFQRAVELAPADPDAWHNLSVTLLFLGRDAQARRAAQKAKQLGWSAQ
jgi:hypothetical protein